MYSMALSCVQAGSADTTFQRSGNPGYIVGEPLVAGNLTTLNNKYLCVPGFQYWEAFLRRFKLFLNHKQH